MKAMVKRAWFWLVIASVLVWLVIIGVWFFRQRGINVEQREQIEFSDQIIAKFNNFNATATPDTSNNASAPFRGSFTCTAKSFSTDRLELAEGYYSIFTANCYYRDGNNREKYLKLPLVVTNQKQTVIAGFAIEDYDPRLEKAAIKLFLCKGTLA
jgi:hypothetical protein